jgi:hypothetical protein
VSFPLIYVAGPYRAPTAWQRERNIHRAREWGVALARAGAYPVIPHSNTAHFDGEADDALWLAGTLELMRRCDGVLLIEGWERSSGARAEADEAARLGIPVVVVEGWLSPGARADSDAAALKTWVRGAGEQKRTEALFDRWGSLMHRLGRGPADALALEENDADARDQAAREEDL